MKNILNNNLMDVYNNYKNTALYEVLNDEIMERLKNKQYDADTLLLCLKTFFCAEIEDEKLNQIMNISYLIFQKQGRSHALDMDVMTSLYPDIVLRCNQIIRDMPDIENLKRVLKTYKGMDVWYEDSESVLKMIFTLNEVHEDLEHYFQIFSEMLETYDEIDFAFYKRALPTLSINAFLDDDVKKESRYIHTYSLHFCSYINVCLDVLEESLNLYDNLKSLTLEDLNESFEESMQKFILEKDILTIHDLIQQADGFKCALYKCSDLAKVAVVLLEERMQAHKYDKDSLDIAEKGLLLAFDETIVVKMLVYIAIIMHSLYTFDEDEFDVLNVCGELSKIAQNAISKKNEKIIVMVKKIFQHINDCYIDYEDAFDEDVIASILDSMDIAYEDAIDYVTCIQEWYYEEYDLKL